MRPNERKNPNGDERIQVEPGSDSPALAGITEYAQDQLGDIVYFDLPRPGTALKPHGKMGEVESVKAVSDLFSPVTGEVVEINERLMDHPELVNEDPYGEGWLVKITLSDSAELDSLMPADEYEAYISGLS